MRSVVDHAEQLPLHRGFLKGLLSSWTLPQWDRETGWICRSRPERWNNVPTGQLGDRSIVTVVANTPTPRYERIQNHASRYIIPHAPLGQATTIMAIFCNMIQISTCRAAIGVAFWGSWKRPSLLLKYSPAAAEPQSTIPMKSGFLARLLIKNGKMSEAVTLRNVESACHRKPARCSEGQVIQDCPQRIVEGMLESSYSPTKGTIGIPDLSA